MKKKVKITIIVSLIFLLLIMTACEKINLPKSPTPPGRQGTFFGQAVAGLHAYPDWAAKPKNMFVYPEEVEMNDEIRVKILNFDYIYRFGYYFNPKNMIWELFELEDGMKLKDWYIGKSARADIKITKDIFEEGENYLVLYACDKIGENSFDCNENKWMLNFFKVLPEEPYNESIIEEDIDDFIFISSKKEKQVQGGEEIRKYTAEYIKDNNKAIVEVATVKTMSAIRSLLKPWNTFRQNYGLYDDGFSYISSYIDDHEYYVLWLSGTTTIKIIYEEEDFPTELVDEYLDKWPSTEINFTQGTIPITYEVCGDSKVGGDERCDPPGIDCIIENFPTVEIDKGSYNLVNNHEIHIIDIAGNQVILNVDGETPKQAGENEIIQFDAGYIHVLRILGNTVRLAFGYDLGKCTSGCRCYTFVVDGEEGVCGNGELNEGEECDPPSTLTQPSPCTAKSGLSSLCNADCECPEPLLGFSFCGDGIVQAPNSMGLLEQCDPPGPYMNGVCTITCQFIPVWINPKGNICGDKLLDPLVEDCDPPGVGCMKNGVLGKCDANCKCGVFSPQQPIDVVGLKNMLCGSPEPECWGFGGECEIDETSLGVCDMNCECDITGETLSEEEIEKLQICGTTDPACWEVGDSCATDEGMEGICNEGCECEIEITEPEENFCGNNVIDAGEECDPAYNLNCDAYLLEGLMQIDGRCDSGCKCNPIYDCTCQNYIGEQDMQEILYYLPSCLLGECLEGMRIETQPEITVFIKKEGELEVMYALILGEGPLDIIGIGKCICVVGTEGGNSVSGAVIVNKFDLRNPKTQLVTAIIACLAILGILTVNFMKRS